jgi:hypothetical protein
VLLAKLLDGQRACGKLLAAANDDSTPVAAECCTDDHLAGTWIDCTMF